MIPVGGRFVASTVMDQLVNLRDGGFISEHDAHIAQKIIEIITGGDVDAGTLVTEDWLLKLERQAFVELIGHPKTIERIMNRPRTSFGSHRSHSYLTSQLLINKDGFP